jgi:hypothetical protein
MTRREGDDEALLERLRLGHDRQIELSCAQLPQRGRYAFTPRDLHTQIELARGRGDSRYA